MSCVTLALSVPAKLVPACSLAEHLLAISIFMIFVQLAQGIQGTTITQLLGLGLNFYQLSFPFLPASQLPKSENTNF